MMKVGTTANLSRVSAAWREQQSLSVQSFIPLFNLIVIRPICYREWSLLCHSIEAFFFPPVPHPFYMTVPSMQKYDLF